MVNNNIIKIRIFVVETCFTLYIIFVIFYMEVIDLLFIRDEMSFIFLVQFKWHTISLKNKFVLFFFLNYILECRLGINIPLSKEKYIVMKRKSFNVQLLSRRVPDLEQNGRRVPSYKTLIKLAIRLLINYTFEINLIISVCNVV